MQFSFVSHTAKNDINIFVRKDKISTDCDIGTGFKSESLETHIHGGG